MSHFLGSLILGFVSFSGAGHGAESAKATFAGGCFWCMEPAFDRIPGVQEVLPGFAGGKKKNPTYVQVSGGDTGHAESVQVTYDPAKVKYEQLLEIFWENVDPTDPGGQFHDRGTQYRTAIFYYDEAQRKAALASKNALAKSKRFQGKTIVTEITKATEFYPAKNYHRKYYQESKIQYDNYRKGSGRDQYLDNVWGKDRIRH